MNSDRLTTLADFLQGRGKYRHKGLKPKKFWMGTWQQSAHGISGRMNNGYCIDGMSNTVERYIEGVTKGKAFKGKDENVIPVECRTVGCALGWAATIPEFRAIGLKLKLMDGGLSDCATPHYKGAVGFFAASGFFDLSCDEAGYLFDPTTYGPKTVMDIDYVANRIRDIAGGKKVPKKHQSDHGFG